MSYKPGDMIPQNTGLPAREVATVTTPDRWGLFWIRIRKQWLLVVRYSQPTGEFFYVHEVKETW